ncbi:MAG: hypothetical protein KKB02_10815 [Alphaproteobacteria bacterium]|nr:hypothetical protein [Alphaproteobacteria bacterium]
MAWLKSPRRGDPSGASGRRFEHFKKQFNDLSYFTKALPTKSRRGLFFVPKATLNHTSRFAAGTMRALTPIR